MPISVMGLPSDRIRPGLLGAHRHDADYPTKIDLTYGPFDYNVGAVRMSVGEQRTWTVRAGYAVVVPQMEIQPGAALLLESGATLALVG